MKKIGVLLFILVVLITNGFSMETGGVKTENTATRTILFDIHDVISNLIFAKERGTFEAAIPEAKIPQYMNGKLNMFTPHVKVLFDWIMAQGWFVYFLSSSPADCAEPAVIELLGDLYGKAEFEGLQKTGQFKFFSKPSTRGLTEEERDSDDPLFKMLNKVPQKKDLTRVLEGKHTLAESLLVDDQREFVVFSQQASDSEQAKAFVQAEALFLHARNINGKMLGEVIATLPNANDKDRMTKCNKLFFFNHTYYILGVLSSVKDLLDSSPNLTLRAAYSQLFYSSDTARTIRSRFDQEMAAHVQTKDSKAHYGSQEPYKGWESEKVRAYLEAGLGIVQTMAPQLSARFFFNPADQNTWH